MNYLTPQQVLFIHARLLDSAKLSKPVSYYAKIRPNYYKAEEAAKAAKA